MTLKLILQDVYVLLSRRLRNTSLRRVQWLGKLHSWFFARFFQPRVVRLGSFVLAMDPRDANIAKKLALYGEYEAYLQQTMLSHVRLGSTAIDIGANVGLHTLPLSRKVGPAGRVIAVEPDPGNYELLTKNIKRNGIENVITYRLALSSKPGTALLYQSGPNRGGLSFVTRMLRRKDQDSSL